MKKRIIVELEDIEKLIAEKYEINTLIICRIAYTCGDAPIKTWFFRLPYWLE